MGALNWLAVYARLDLIFAVSYLCQFLQKPLTRHMKMVKRVLRYLKGTIYHGVHYEAGNKAPLTGWSDADWAGDAADRRSYGGYLFKVGNGPVSARTKKQNVVALSSCESELMSLSDTTKEAVWQIKV